MSNAQCAGALTQRNDSSKHDLGYGLNFILWEMRKFFITKMGSTQGIKTSNSIVFFALKNLASAYPMLHISRAGAAIAFKDSVLSATKQASSEDVAAIAAIFENLGFTDKAVKTFNYRFNKNQLRSPAIRPINIINIVTFVLLKKRQT